MGQAMRKDAQVTKTGIVKLTTVLGLRIRFDIKEMYYTEGAVRHVARFSRDGDNLAIDQRVVGTAVGWEGDAEVAVGIVSRGVNGLGMNVEVTHKLNGGDFPQKVVDKFSFPLDAVKLELAPRQEVRFLDDDGVVVSLGPTITRRVRVVEVKEDKYMHRHVIAVEIEGAKKTFFDNLVPVHGDGVQFGLLIYNSAFKQWSLWFARHKKLVERERASWVQGLVDKRGGRRVLKWARSQLEAG